MVIFLLLLFHVKHQIHFVHRLLIPGPLTGSSQLFSSYSPYAGNKKIKIADESLSIVADMGSIVISPTLTLYKVLHVPNLSCNLLSISKITSDLKCRVNFFSSFCEFQDD